MGRVWNQRIIARDRRLGRSSRRSPCGKRLKPLRAVHQAGFIHHDICPRNFVCSQDLKSLKLIDFGLTIPSTPEFLKPGNRTGTPNYMPPEVIHRRKNDLRLPTSFRSERRRSSYVRSSAMGPAGRATGQAALAHDQATDIRIAASPHHPTAAWPTQSTVH